MILECTKGHKWNTSFDISYSHLKSGDPCPLPVKWNKKDNPPITLCGLPLKNVVFERGEKKKKKGKFQPKKRIPIPYNRSRSKRKNNEERKN